MPVKEFKSHSTNDSELKKELIDLSLKNPDKFYSFRAMFGNVTIQEHVKTPSSGYGDDCYRFLGGFLHAGKIVKPSAAWMKVYNFIPVQR